MTTEERVNQVETARSSYDAMSSWYDILSGPWEDRLRRELLEEVALGKPCRILEVGCGTGEMIKLLAERYGDGVIAGVDVSEGMLEVAERKLAESPKGDPQLVLGDANGLPFGCSRFDAVFLVFTLEIFEGHRRAEVLSECQRVLAPSGTIFVMAVSGEGEGGFVFDLYKGAHGIFPDLVDCAPIHAARELESHGFEISGSRLLRTWGFPIEMVWGSLDKNLI